MCGVTGYFGDIDSGREILAAIMSLQDCRGPDDSGTWEKTLRNGLKVGLGHNRLSIIDLSAEGHQPMSDSYDNIVISFNGEIYNYKELRVELQNMGWKFKSNSDTEVLLAAYCIWGDSALEKFNGMFSVIIVDLNRNLITLNRSRMGSKPLHFGKMVGGWIFSSTASPLATVLKSPLDVDYLLNGCSSWIYDTNNDRTAFKGIYSVSPGTTVSFNLSDTKSPPSVRTWYSLSAKIVHQEKPIADEDSLTDQLSQLITESVELRLRADVPVGISLSGGLDSTVIASCMGNIVTQPFHAFTFHSEKDYNEGKYIPKIQNHFQSEMVLHRVGIPNEKAMPSAINKTLHAQDAPIASLSVVAQNLIYKAAAAEGIKVMLGGQGADEILMGYSKYRYLYALEAMKKGHFASSLSYSLGLGWSVASDPKLISEKLAAFLRPKYGARTLAQNSNPSKLRNNFSSLDQLSLNDISVSSLPTLLRYEDRNSMDWSVESRLPFLDFKLVEFCLNIPVELKIQPYYGKYLLRRAFSDSVPSEIAWNKNKRGFEPGNRIWMKNGAGNHLRSLVADSKQSLINFGFPREMVIRSQESSDSMLMKSTRVMSETLMLSWAAQWTK